MRVAEQDDYSSLIELSQEVGWNYELKDFIIMERSGCSKTLVADEGRIIGMITTFDYGEIGWISNLLVDKSWRKIGLGRSLLVEGIRMLGNKKTIALFSNQESIPFYLKNGFIRDRDLYFVKFIGGYCGEVSLKKVEWNESMEVMDRLCFGYNRGRLLRILAESGSVVSPTVGQGFAIIRPGAMENTVGPVICNDSSFLYSAMSELGVGSTAVTPCPNPMYTKIIFKVALMYFGEKPKIDYTVAQAFAGLEYG